MAKFCLECGAPVIEGTSFCPECGASVLPAKSVKSAQAEEMPKNYLGVGIAATVLSCYLGLNNILLTVCGILSLVYSNKVAAYWAEKDYENAKSASKKAKIWGLIGLIGSCLLHLALIIFLVIYFILYFGVIMAALSGAI